MTLKELQTLFSDANKKTWHQHPNGKGWIQNTAKVANTVWIGPNALVYGNAQIYDNVRVYGDAQVYGRARVCGDSNVYGSAYVSGNVLVCGDSHVYGSAYVSGNAKVYGESKVYGDAQVYGDALICDDAHVSRGHHNRGKVLIIIMDPYPLTYNGDDFVHIGCECHTFLDWKKNGLKIMKNLNLNLNEETLKNYKNALNFIQQYKMKKLEKL